MEESFIAWIFIMSFGLVAPAVVFLTVAHFKGYLKGDEEMRRLAHRSYEADYWQGSWEPRPPEGPRPVPRRIGARREVRRREA